MKATIESKKLAQRHTDYDVLISGAGPVGLFLACELALAGCSVLVLEKTTNPHSPLKRLPFGIRGLSAPTVDALYRRGLLEELAIHKRLKTPHQNTSQEGRHQAGHFAGIPFYNDDIDTAQWPYRLPDSVASSLISEIEELETVLGRRAASFGVNVKRGLALTGFHQTEDVVTVQAGDQSFTAGWLVGCDGSRSVVRKTGGFDFAGTEPAFTGYTAQVDMVDPEKLNPGRNITATGMYLQSQPGYLVIQDFDGGTFHDAGKPITPGHIQAVLRRISSTDVTINKLHMATTWTDRARQATRYRSGRVLLAGDSAHIHAPLGGQGLNLGIGDAMNLGWKLAMTIQNNAPESLLDSYHTERYPVGAQVLDWSRAQVAIMKPDPSARALNAIIRDLMNTRDGATYFAGRVWGIATHYDLGGNHPLVGHSVPNLDVGNGVRIGELLHGGQAILLDFEGNGFLDAVSGEYGDRIKYVLGRTKEQAGLSAMLIRPDGIVAWVSTNNPDEVSLRQAITRWFVPQPK